MANSLSNLQPAQDRSTDVYKPYFKGEKQRQQLPLALSLYQMGYFEGQREIEGGTNIPFVATWNIASMPVDLTRCRVQFDGNADFSYEITMSNFEFIGFLIEVLTRHKRDQLADFPKSFYRKLLKLDE